MTYRIGFIGTGDPDGEGFAMAYRHASGYQRLDDCEIVACADIVAENANVFAAAHDVPDQHVYESYEAMLESANPDVVSVCVPPGAHADIVTDVAESGVPAAVHCEKPMALTWGEARRMAAVCASEGVQLTINHQLRFGRPYREAKRLLEEGTIGDLVRVEFQEQTLYDNGTHSFDLVNYFNDQRPVEWVLGQVDYTEENTLFGAHNENQAVVQWRYDNGVYGLASTGRGASYTDVAFRLFGTDGVVEIDDDGGLSYRQDGGSWQPVDTGPDRRYQPEPGTLRRGTEVVARKVSERVADRVGVTTYTERAVEDVVSALRSGGTSPLDAEFALDADELIFAAWESARRRGRVDLPLDVDDNPLESMVDSGALTPEPTTAAD
ncbi:Gfo/Idh/MocA family protein [Halosimplex amylolyticum]|uniref:Gfo/Idh/MocA family protein n=1 Tax=Halosimplex amylolyticum TaxID=3396616 RepID=UPI003F57A2F8